MRLYYDAFRFAGEQSGITQLDQTAFIELDGSIESAETYRTKYILSGSVLAIVNYIWLDAVIHNPNGTHMVQYHQINQVAPILLNTSDIAIDIIGEQLLQGLTVGVNASIGNAQQQFHNFLTDNEGEIVATNVSINYLEEAMSKYFFVMLTKLALDDDTT